MNKPRKQRSGFSNTAKSQASKTQLSNNSACHTAKEHQAITLISQEKFLEAEAIYRELIAAGTRNHIVYNNLATLCGMQGRFDELIDLLNKTLQLNPNYPEAHYNLGIALQQQGDLTAAISSFNTALQLKPNYPDAHINLGNALQEQGDLTAAISSFNIALQLKPNHPDAHINLGIALQQQGDLTAAISSFNTALQLNPNYPDAYINLGIALQQRGDLTAAISSFNTALQLNPNHTDAHINLGITHQQRGDLTAAISSYNTALQLNPNHTDTHNNLCTTPHQRCGRETATTEGDTALQLNPNHTDTHNNLGIALQQRGDLTAAISSYNTALQLNPNHPNAHINLGNALQEQGDLTAAIASYNTALQLNPNHPNAHNNLGNALQEQGDLTAAIASYNTALQLNPNYPDAIANLSHCLLTLNKYEEGWEKYEWRHKRDKAPALHARPQSKRWNGELPINKATKLLLVSEQGLGDTLQFMRYAVALKSQGTSVLFCAPEKLHSLIQASGIDPSPLTPQQANKVSDVQWIPLLSVPKYLKISPQHPIITQPYIKTTQELIAKWKAILSIEKRPIIGINWQGNPTHEKTNSKGRSLPLETFATIAYKSKVSLLSLQKGFGSEQLETCSFKDHFVSCQDQINGTWDFLETAAIIANCDLVITSDTSVAHLAGGMGKTTWLLVQKTPDWRWGLKGDTTFWYPSMRLFRQNERGNWNDVLEQVEEALQQHLTSNSTVTEKRESSPGTQEPEWETVAITLDPKGTRFNDFKRNNQHLNITPFQAIRGVDLTKEELIKQNIATRELVAASLQTNGQIGSAASHKALWERSIKEQKSFFIMEDDCYTHPRINDFIASNLQKITRADICFFGINTDSILLSTSPQGLTSVKLFEPRHPSPEWIKKAFSLTITEKVELHKLIKAFGLCAYFISPNGAQKLIDKIFPLSLKTTTIPLITESMPAISTDRSGCTIYAEIEALVCTPMLAYTPNTNSSTKIQ